MSEQLPDDAELEDQEDQEATKPPRSPNEPGPRYQLSSQSPLAHNPNGLDWVGASTPHRATPLEVGSPLPYRKTISIGLALVAAMAVLGLVTFALSGPSRTDTPSFASAEEVPKEFIAVPPEFRQPPAQVPDFLGWEYDDARRNLSNFGPYVRTVPSSAQHASVITSQHPSPGSPFPSEITLTVPVGHSAASPSQSFTAPNGRLQIPDEFDAPEFDGLMDVPVFEARDRLLSLGFAVVEKPTRSSEPHGTIVALVYTPGTFDVPEVELTVSSRTISRLAVLAESERHSGTPYVWGGATPDEGFDNSGFTQYVFAQLGIPLPRGAEDQRAFVSTTTDPRPGDLVFFGNPAYHVGIYAGDNNLWDAGRPGIPVQLRAIWPSGDVTYGTPPSLGDW